MESKSVQRILIDAFSGDVTGDSKEFFEELDNHLRGVSDDDLCAQLVAFDLAAEGHPLSTSAAINRAVRFLAPDDEPPHDGLEREAWRILLSFLELRHGSGVYPMGRLSFISDPLIRGLAEEARTDRPDASTRRTTGKAGDLLAGLAVSRQLREAVSSAVGTPVIPTYDALYEYDPPESSARCHTDSDAFEFTTHVLVEHTADRAEGQSVMIVFRAGEVSPKRIALKPGDTVVIRGRGTIHRWERLGAKEHRILSAIGFRAGP
ncbi:MAG: hypothetical protein ABI718_05015 [Acidobacteriota bacterium]